jgi:glyoxylase-like metal-dependent hydrolase (beta-lactamase superfamily II)
MLRITSYGDVTRIDLARTLAGRGRYWTTAYAVDGMLIDTGCAHSAQELSAALADGPISYIVNTHSHEDHIGANGLLQSRFSGAQILAHPLALPVLADPRHRQPLHLYRSIMWGWPRPSLGRPLADGDIIATERYRFEALYTPGHCSDHLCLFEREQGWLFSGDLFVGGQDRALRADCDIWQIIASLKRIATLPARLLFPGSARVRDNAREALRAKIVYLEQFGAATLALGRRGWSVSHIVRALCGGPMPIELITLGHFSRRWLIRSYLGKQESAAL